MKRSLNHRRNLLDLTVVMALFVTLALIGGCSTNTAGPGETATQSQLDWLNVNLNQDGPSSATAVNIQNCPVLFDTTLVADVDWRGYQLDMVHGAEKIGFSLPWSAVDKTIKLKIHVTKYRASFGDFWLLDCGPDGQVFKYPLYVMPNQAALNGSTAVLFYYNPTTKQWEVQQTVRGSNPQLAISHFSKYGIS